MSAPSRIAIDHDDYHASHIGRLADGRQFFLTTPFVPEHRGESGREFVALYLFDEQGRLQKDQIRDLGPRDSVDQDRRQEIFDRLLNDLGDSEFCRIEVQPFQIERFGTTFGLVPRPPEDEDDDWWIEAQPGNYMAFHEPWDSGEYDT